MSKFLLFICPEAPLPVAVVTIEADNLVRAMQTASEAIDKWVETGKAVGFDNVERPKAYFTPDVGIWL